MSKQRTPRENVSWFLLENKREIFCETSFLEIIPSHNIAINNCFKSILCGVRKNYGKNYESHDTSATTNYLGKPMHADEILAKRLKCVFSFSTFSILYYRSSNNHWRVMYWIAVWIKVWRITNSSRVRFTHWQVNKFGMAIPTASYEVNRCIYIWKIIVL